MQLPSTTKCPSALPGEVSEYRPGISLVYPWVWPKVPPPINKEVLPCSCSETLFLFLKSHRLLSDPTFPFSPASWTLKIMSPGTWKPQEDQGRMNTIGEGWIEAVTGSAGDSCRDSDSAMDHLTSFSLFSPFTALSTFAKNPKAATLMSNRREAQIHSLVWQLSSGKSARSEFQSR